MKPYIEYNEIKYEFEANFTLKREFDLEIQKRYNEMAKSGEVTQEELSNLKIVRDFILSNPNITEEELEKNQEMKERIIKYVPILDKLILNDIYEKYCYLMLEKKYGINKETWNKMLEQYFEDYCESTTELNELFSKVVEKVFTQMPSKKKKSKMDWMA